MTKQSDKEKNTLKVFQYAKDQNMSSKEVMAILKKINMPVQSHMSVMEPVMIEKIQEFYRNIKANAAVKQQQVEQQKREAQQAAAIQAANEARAREVEAAKRAAAAKAAAEAANAPTPAPAPVAVSPAPEKPQVAKAEPSNVPAKPSSSPSTPSPAASTPRPAAQASSGATSRPQGGSQSGGYQGNRPAGQGQGGGYQGNRPAGQGQGGGYQGNRPSSQGQGGGYQGNRPAAQGQGGGYQGNRPAGQGQGQGGGYQGNRPAGAPGQRPTGQGGFGGGGNRPQQGGRNNGPFIPAPPAQTTHQATGGGSRNVSKSQFKHKDNSYERGGTAFGDGRRGGNQGFGGKGGKGKNKARNNMPPKEKIDNTPKKIIVRGDMTVGELAKLLHKDASEVIKKLILMGVMATINQEIDVETVQLIAGEFGVEDVEVKIKVEEDNFETQDDTDEDENLEERPPVVTIMGHVDHGKTTLLDAIRKTNVTGGEAGGITQHIGAYQVEINHKKITFLDTPGHEAFTLMRARGAQVTDITIIVVAADDGVMPQTVEAISHAKAANVPIIVAVNKIDKPAADVDRIKNELTKYELVPEEWGGDTMFVEVSAKQRIGLENLLENILLVAEVNEFRANPNKRARGTVIEAELDKGKGPVARILIQNGTLKVGDAFIAGNCFGRVRAMVNDHGRRIKEAGPSTPVEITGLTDVPLAGDPMLVFEDERKAREIADRRTIKQRQSELGANTRVSLDDLFQHIKDGDIKDLNVIIKADVQGSAEALKGSLAKIDVDGVRVKILLSGVGAITESDINLAAASSAIVIGFNTRPEPQAVATAELEKVDIRLHNIIYNVIDEIEHAMKGMLEPEYKEVVIGQAEVRNLFKVSKVGTIAGSMVIDGKIQRNAKARVLRSKEVIFQGEIESLKRFKDDAKEVAQGYECGITLNKFNDLQEGDIIEAYIMEEIKR